MVGQNIQAHASAKNWDILAPTSAELDLTDPKAVRAYIKMHKPDLVVHAAGRVGGIQANMADQVGFLDRNNIVNRGGGTSENLGY